MGTPEPRQLQLRDERILTCSFWSSLCQYKYFPWSPLTTAPVDFVALYQLGGRRAAPLQRTLMLLSGWSGRVYGWTAHLALSPLKRDHVSLVRLSMPHYTFCVCTHINSQSCSHHLSFSDLGCTNQIPNIGLCFGNHCLKRRKVARRNDPYHRDGACYGIYKWHSQDE